MYMEKIKWPDEIKCASIITVNLNAELFWLQLDPNVENMPKTLSMGQYGMTKGLKRVLDVLDVFNFNATFFIPGKIAEIYPEQVKEVVLRGHEIASMGYAHEKYGLISPNEQEIAMKKGIAALSNCCGCAPIGFRAPDGELTLETLKIAKKCGFKYSSNLCDDDRPYWKNLNDTEKLLEIPVHWPLYDLPYFAFNYNPAFPTGQGRIANYTGVLNNWKDEFTGYYNLGLCYVLQLDPQTIGNPGRIGMLEELLSYIKEFKGTWNTTGSEIYKYFNKNSYYGTN